MANNEINAEKIIDGKIISSKVLKEVSESIIQIKSNGLEPCLAVVLVGNDPASSVYVRNKKMMCEKVGIKSIDFNLDERISEEELLDIIINLNKDKRSEWVEHTMLKLNKETITKLSTGNYKITGYDQNNNILVDREGVSPQQAHRPAVRAHRPPPGERDQGLQP